MTPVEASLFFGMKKHLGSNLLVTVPFEGLFYVFDKLTKPEPRKKPSYFLFYWMVNRDPYNGSL